MNKTNSLWRILNKAFTSLSIVAVLIVGIACQSNKGSGSAKTIGKNVRMTELRNTIQSSVVDNRRASALLDIVVHAERELGLANENFIEMSKDFGKASADHSKSASYLDSIIRERDKEASARRLRLTNMLLTMRTHATEQEWPLISNAFFNSIMNQSDRYRAVRGLNS